MGRAFGVAQCLWWLVGDLERSDPALFGWDPAVENIWLPEAYLFAPNATLLIKWTHSFYWGAGMVTSMVPKDVEPVTFLECSVTAVAMVRRRAHSSNWARELGRPIVPAAVVAVPSPLGHSR